MPNPRTDEITALLLEWRGGNQAAVDMLLPRVYAEPRRVARRQMEREPADHLLQATALVNEAYLRLVDLHRVQWQDRAHFFAVAARVMRRVLVDFARAQKNQKRGGGLQRVTLTEFPGSTNGRQDVIEIDDALTALASQYERKAQVVELRFFGGLSAEENSGRISGRIRTLLLAGRTLDRVSIQHSGKIRGLRATISHRRS